MRCKPCGAPLKSWVDECEYCGTETENKKKRGLEYLPSYGYYEYQGRRIAEQQAMAIQRRELESPSVLISGLGSILGEWW